ncbi:TPA: hypothetical protein DF272_04455 [Candidatus Falkowbacteria bacterium]|nr:hypothetical protein [Candidatus Falkowbacteria bacterium]
MSNETNTPVVRVGDVIYIRGGMSLSHGVDDYTGGKATVTVVKMGVSGGRNVPFVSVREVPGHSWNWESLAQDQAALRESHGESWAAPDPDERPEFNEFW